MKSRWKVSSTYLGGEKVYQVYRTIDESQPDHSGNREHYDDVLYLTKEDAQAKADDLNFTEMMPGR